jgi:uncharacterized membrane protein YgcG
MMLAHSCSCQVVLADSVDQCPYAPVFIDRRRRCCVAAAVALVLCLNIGVDPPDVIKISPCARLECWVDPLSMQPAKALETIGEHWLAATSSSSSSSSASRGSSSTCGRGVGIAGGSSSTSGSSYGGAGAASGWSGADGLPQLDPFHRAIM